MGLDAVRAALASDARRVLVEAPAGCGKTFEAVRYAIETSKFLRNGQEVLLLAHTNAAVDVFQRRVRDERASVHATTLDAFALSLVAPYAEALGLPTPFQPGTRPGDVAFHQLAGKALELLRRSPSIAASLSAHYPVVLLDEHQDARTEQDALATTLGATSRLRLFGDPMQAIYGFGDEIVSWDVQRANADCTVVLDEPRRWTDVPALGEWMITARDALANGRTLPLDHAPASVRVLRLRDLPDQPNPGSDRAIPALTRPLHQVLERLEGSVVVLARYNAHVRGLYSSVRGALTVDEGSDYQAAHDALADAEAALGDPQAMTQAALQLIGSHSRGVDKATRQQFERAFLADRVERGRRERIRVIIDAFEPLYDSPTLHVWCRALRHVLRNRPEWLSIDLPESLRVLAGLELNDDELPRQSLETAIRQRRVQNAQRVASTIHKAKGREFDHVVIAHCSASPLPDDIQSRRLLYVALSRARKSITLMASGDAPSPLLGE